MTSLLRGQPAVSPGERRMPSGRVVSDTVAEFRVAVARAGGG